MPRPKQGYYHPVTNKRLVGPTTPIGMLKDSYATDNLLDWAQSLALNMEEENGILFWRPIYWKWARNRRGLIGSEAHALSIGYATKTVPDVEDIIFDDLYIPECSLEATAYLNAFIKWWGNNRYEILAYEQQLINPNDNYGGTPDMVLKNGQQIIADIKTGYVNEYICALQLAAYGESWRLGHGKGAMPDGLIIGFTDKDGEKTVKTYSFTCTELDNVYDDFLRIKDIYHNQQNFMKVRRVYGKR